MKTIVMKFGGKAVEKTERFPLIADLILKRKKEFGRVVVVISAMGNLTDQLIKLAYSICDEPPKREYDMLVSVGERISIALLAMALHTKGCEAVSFTGSQSGIITTNDHTDARIIDVRPDRLLPPLQEGKIVIVAGFQGVSSTKEITTLGRGGSDTTAVAVASALNAKRVEFYKDVPGIFEEDPQKSLCQEHFHKLNFEEALAIVEKTGGRVLAPRAILLAKKNQMPLVVRSFCEEFQDSLGTCISEESPKPKKPGYESEGAIASQNN